MRIPGTTTTDPKSDQFQTKAFIDFIQRDRLLKRRTLRVVVSTVAATLVRHGLGYVPEGYAMIRQSGPVDIYDTGMTDEQITLWGTADADITLMVW
jgi:hypothetical protein